MKPILTVINLVLLALVSYSSVGLVYTLLQNHLLAREPLSSPDLRPPPSAPPVHQSPPSPDYQQVVTRNLFNIHKAVAPLPMEPAAIETLKKTDLQVTLRGTIVSPPNAALAVIEVPRMPGQQIVRIGDDILHARLTQILREKIVLEVDGQSEILEIDRESKGGLRPPAPAVPAVSDPWAAAAPDQQIDVQLARPEVEQALQNLNQLMREVRVRPNFSDGRPDGFSLSGITPDSFFSQAGLQNGDVIYGVDGEAIQSMEDAMKFYSRLQNAPQFRLEIRRQGRPLALNFRVQ